MAGEGVELIFLSDDLFFLILNASFLGSITTPVLGISPNKISIPLLSLKDIPSVSSSTVFLISFEIFFNFNNSLKLFPSLFSFYAHSSLNWKSLLSPFKSLLLIVWGSIV